MSPCREMPRKPAPETAPQSGPACAVFGACLLAALILVAQVFACSSEKSASKSEPLCASFDGRDSYVHVGPDGGLYTDVRWAPCGPGYAPAK